MLKIQNLKGYNSNLGLTKPKIKKGIPTINVQDLKSCPVIAGIINPMTRGKPIPIRSPNSRRFFFEFVIVIINLIQIPVAKFRHSVLLVVYF